MKNIPEESDVLTRFEQDNLPAPYKEYFTAKRQNFVMNIDSGRPLWDCFMLLDKIWISEFEDMGIATTQSKAFPLFLFANAHAKMRVVLELGFSSCLPEAHSILRDAVESVAHGHMLYSDSDLVLTWLQKHDNEETLEAWREEFWHDKEHRLFDGLPELHKAWKMCSEWGSHTNIRSIAQRFVVQQTPTSVTWRLHYTGVQPDILIKALFGLLHVFAQMENVLFKDCEGRLKLDTKLEGLRRKFQHDKEAVRKRIVAQPKDQYQDPESSKAVTGGY
jgi:hypothetical protein